MYKINPWRPVAFTIGCIAGGISCFGAYEYALKLEGGQVTYLTIGAPLVALCGSLIPPMAENVWKRGELLKSFLWWVAIIPVLALMFYSSAERVHMAKALQHADIVAHKKAAVRANADLTEAKELLKESEAQEAVAKSTKKCNTDCQSKIEYAKSLREKVEKAENSVLLKESLAVEESEWKPPVWLLPVALDIITFMAIWTGLSGNWVSSTTRLADRERKYPGVIPVQTKPQSMREMVKVASSK